MLLTKYPSFSVFLKQNWLAIFFIVLFFIFLEIGAAHFYLTYLSENHTNSLLSLISFNSLTTAVLALAFLFIAKTFSGNKTPKTLKAFSTYFHEAMDHVRNGVFLAEADGKISYANRALCQYHGYSNKNELIGKKWSVLYDENHLEWINKYILPALEKDNSWSGHTKGRKLNGELFNEEISFIQFKCGRIIGVMQDITEKIEASQESETRLAAIEATEDGIGIVNSRGLLIFINKALMDLHGIREEHKTHYIGRHWENLYSKKGRKYIKENVLPEFERHKNWRGESLVEKLNGEVVHAELSLSKTPDGGMIGTARDITNKKRNEKEKAELKEQFYQAQKMEAIGRLAGGIAHDFNNILAAIMGYSEFLLDDLEKGTPEHEFARHIHSAGYQARDLVDQMLTFSRISETSNEIIDLTSPFEKTVKMIKSSLPKTMDIKTKVNIDHPFINCNETKIGQVLMNMCVNAKDAMEDKTGKLVLKLENWEAQDPKIKRLFSDRTSKKIETPPPARVDENSKGEVFLYLGKLERDQNYARLTIADTGSGITQQVAKHIFEPFYTTKDINKGTGLGMSMVHGIITESSGALYMKSHPDTGTHFELFFPLVEDIDEEDNLLEDVTEAAAGQGLIMIVEDQKNIKIMLSKMLERMGYEVISFESPDKAWAYMQEPEQKCDLVITDYTMPGMTGLEFAQKIVGQFPELPVILISGYAQNRLDKAQNDSPNIKAVLRKPLRSENLSESISQALEKGKVS